MERNARCYSMMKLIKKYPQLWVLSYFLLYIPWFVLLEARNSDHCTIIQLKLDRMIPFCEYFIIPYLLWFFYIAAGIAYMLFTQPKKQFYQFTGVLFGGMTVCLILYTFFFTGLNLRPLINPDKNLFTRMVAHLWAIDTSTNVCPSIHVFATMAVQSALTRCRFDLRHPVLYQGSTVLSLLIVLSTMFLKQHSVIDVFCAFLLVWAMHRMVYGVSPVYTSNRLRLQRS